MDKDFEKWLKQDELFEYYNANPEHQDDIYKDYQREREYIKPENIDEWLKWLCNNPELAEKHYPLLVNGLKERIQNTQPFQTANIIQNLPEHFTAYKTEINNHVGNYREKRIKEQITLLNSVLNEWQYSNEVVQQAVESVRPYLTEQLEYWKGELRLKVNSNEEIVKGFKQGQTKFILPNSFLNSSTIQQQPNIEPPPQQSEKPKPKLNEALISFSSTEIIDKLHNELKGYFQGKEAELKKALQGEQLKEFLLFPHNGNKFVEVFKRLKYNVFLLNKPKETNDWICSTFTYQYQKGNKKEVREFNASTVHDILTKDKGEPTKKERICIVDWLPYKSHLTRQKEAEKESI